MPYGAGCHGNEAFDSEDLGFTCYPSLSGRGKGLLITALNGYLESQVGFLEVSRRWTVEVWHRQHLERALRFYNPPLTPHCIHIPHLTSFCQIALGFSPDVMNLPLSKCFPGLWDSLQSSDSVHGGRPATLHSSQVGDLDYYPGPAFIEGDVGVWCVRLLFPSGAHQK